MRRNLRQARIRPERLIPEFINLQYTMKKIVFLLIAAGLLLNVSAVHACSCVPPGTPAEELKKSTAVFAGKVIGIEAPRLVVSSANPVKVTFEVSKVWKGPSSKNVVITTALNEASCGYSFKEGREYIVYAHGKENELSTGICSRTKLLSDAREELAELGEGITPNLQVIEISAQSQESLHVHAVAWNGDYWLIGGRLFPEDSSFMVRYDGRNFQGITPEGLKSAWIKNISWDGKRWVISGEEIVITGKKLESTYRVYSHYKAYAYDGKSFANITPATETRVEDVKKETLEACNQDYCLLWKKAEGKLLKYDGKSYADLTKESGIQFPFESVRMMVWNGEYWLIGFGGMEGGGVVKYDGKSFTTITGLPHVPPVSIPQFLQTAPAAIVWNGKYWLIGTVASPRLSGSLVKYDGSAVTDLTPELKSSAKGQVVIDEYPKTQWYLLALLAVLVLAIYFKILAIYFKMRRRK